MGHQHDHVRLKSNLGGEYEEVAVIRLADGRYELLSSPIAVMGFAAGDLIEQVGDDHRVVPHGGILCVQIFIDQPVGGELEWFENHAEPIGQLDNLRPNTFVLNVPAEVGHARTVALMDEFIVRFPGCLYQYGNVYEEGTGIPLEWAKEFLSR